MSSGFISSPVYDALFSTVAVAVFLTAVLAWCDRRSLLTRAALIAVCIALGFRYILWRSTTIPSLASPVDFGVGLLFYCVEALALLGSTLTLILLTRLRNRTAETDRNIDWWASLPSPPRVDVLICTYNEDYETLEPTIMASKQLEYPNFRVWVCDDGKREWLRSFCEANQIGYLVRKDNKGAKAGNINAALQVLAAAEHSPEFVAILDADFVPMTQFLARTVALMLEPDVAIVQTPQHFFNSDPIQNNLSIASVWPDEQRFFFDTIMPSRDAWGLAFCCGTSSLIRFSALRELGGVPTDSVTEDYLLSLKLRQRGYRTVYLNEVLSLGLAPEGLKEYYGQRSRWCLGAMQIIASSNGPFRLKRGLSLRDRIGLIDSFLYWAVSHLMRVFALVIPSMFLLFGIEAVHAQLSDALEYFAPYALVQIIALFWLSEGRILPVMSDLYQVLCATEVLKSVCSGLMRPRGRAFAVTAKGGDRRKRIIQWPMLRVFLSLLCLNLFSIAYGFIFVRTASIDDSSSIAFFWCWYNIIVLVLACLVCLERPQRRYRHRFKIYDQIPIEIDGTSFIFRSRDISFSGVRLIGESPLRSRQTADVFLDGHTLRARAARKTEDGFTLAFEAKIRNRAILTKYIFARRYLMQAEHISSKRLALSIAARMFR
jgi:cellulose synthase (UDP-forming)